MEPCPKCSGFGRQVGRSSEGYIRYVCRSCGRNFGKHEDDREPTTEGELE